jgi:membrane protease YdiL (CAAX protease family)
MGLNKVTLSAVILGFFLVILVSLVIIIRLWIKTKKIAYSLFLAQIAFLIVSFFMFIRIILKISKATSQDIVIIGVLWTCSMACMLSGISMLSKQNTNPEQSVEEKIEYDPNLKRALGMFAFYIILCPIILGIILVIVSGIIDFSADDPLVYIFMTLAQFGILVLWLSRKYLMNFKSMISFRNISPMFFIPMFISILGLGILLSEIENFFQRVVPINDFWLKILGAISGDGFAPWKAVLAAVVVAPILEEIVFRGMLLRGLLKHYSVRKSIIISAIFFGIAHMNPWQFIAGLAAGIVLGWWYVKTRSIIVTIFGHALNNSMVFIAPVMGLKIPGYNATSDISNHQPLWFDILGLILLAGGTIWLIKLFNKRQVNFERPNIIGNDSDL